METLFSDTVQNWTPLSAETHLFAAFDKPGEHAALAHAYENEHDAHVPMFHFAGPKRPKKISAARKMRGEKQKQQDPITRGQLSGFATRVKETVGDRPVYVDVYGTQMGKRIKQDLKRTVLGKPIPELYAACRKAGIRFMPVLDVLKPELYREPVKAEMEESGRGAAFRLRLNGKLMKADGALESVLSSELDFLESSCDEIDLVLDLGFLSIDAELRADLYATIIDRVRAIGKWRSISLLGSSIPAMMSDVKRGQFRNFVRHEFNLWRDLRDLGYDQLVLGDYGVQHPAPPLQSMGPGGYANVRYTVGEFTIVSRGFEPLLESDMHEQYKTCCDHLVGHRLFSGDETSPADVEIEACSDEGRCAIDQGVWRRVGTQRHLLVVRDQIK